MRVVLTFIFLSMLSSVYADVSKQNVDEMLKQMVREEVISATEAEKARIRLYSMSDKQWKALNFEGQKVASRSPASAPTIGDSTDLYQAQFKQIQDDISKITPSRRD